MYTRESKIMRKLLGRAAPDSATGDVSSIAGTTTPVASSFRPSKSQDAVYFAGAPISCFDVSSDRRAVILAGPHILKTLFLDDPASPSFIFNDGINVRAAITTQHSIGSRSNVVADQLNIRDVKWHSGSCIYTACASGKVFSYDLTRLAPGNAEPFEHILMHEDSRQVNSLDINPHLQSWLLTGGQDGTARVFDSNSTTSARHGISFRQRFAPLRCIDPIRKVTWSPKQGHEMACCTDSGVVMKWDVRQPSRPVLRINAHEKACSTIAWHPDGVHILSAGGDTKIQVWDFGHSADKRQKPKWTLSGPAPVAAVAWRPGLWSGGAQARRVAQVAVTYDEASSRTSGTSVVHIWDFARPTMPYKEIESFGHCPSAIWWQDQDMLWTVGQDGTFNQRDVAFARRVIDRQSTSAMAFSPRGDAFLFLDERSNSNRPRFHGTHPTEMMHGLSLSRGDSGDDGLASFLGPLRRASRKRRLSGRDGVPLSTTPPSGGPSFPDDAKQNLGLEQSVNITGTFKSQQAMAFGHMPAAMPVQTYQFMSSAYLDTLKYGLPYVAGSKCMVERVGDILEQFAKASEFAHLYRLAQTWRILAYAMSVLLKRRAQYHFEVRAGQFQKMHLDDRSRGPDGLKPLEMCSIGEDTPRRPPTQRSSIDGRVHVIRSLLAEEIESTSNVPTPVARPADSSSSSKSNNNNINASITNNVGGFNLEDSSHTHGRRLSPIVEPESLNLGPAAYGSFEESQSARKRLDSEPISVESRRTEKSGPSCLEGHESFEAEVSAKAIDVPMTRRRNDGKGPPFRGGTARHESDESLEQMFSISSGTRKSGAMGSSGEAFARPGLVREQSDMEKESGASSQDSPVISEKWTEKNGRPSRLGDSTDEDEYPISQTTKIDEHYACQSSSTSQGTNGTDCNMNMSPRNSIRGNDSGRCMTSPTKKESTSPRRDPRPRIVETDYLPWSHDPPYPHPSSVQEWRGAVSSISALDPCGLLLRVLDYECKKSALHASAIIMLLKPLVPDSVIDTHRATGILRQHHRRLMQMSLFVEAALVRNLCLQGWPEGLADWGENYTSIFSGAQQGVKVGLFCSWCRKPRQVDPRAGDAAVWTCERCRSVMAPCSVCGHREAQRPSLIPAEIAPRPSDVEFDMWLSEWWYCPGCAHGGHASCLQLWHGASETISLADASTTYSDGCCASDGCGHACLAGKYRGETTTARSNELGRAAVDSSRARDEGNKPGPGSRGGSRRSSPGAGFERSVRSDGNDVPQSKAVAMAREALNKGSGGGILSSSPGRMTSTGDRERRKSVKFARQDHE